ncbi:MAG: ABC transporter permease, partial [Lachnospiraceae bacterium]|nr:ABC transporter permease [Lachnospiraceae bacterium]
MFHIVYKYIKGYKKNTVLCILGIAFSVTLMFSVIQMGNRLLFQFRQMLNSVAGDDFQVVDISFEQMDQIYSYIQSNAVEFSSMKRTIYGTSRFDDNLATIQIAGVEGQWQDLLNVSLLAGEPPAESNEICVEQKYCDYLKKDMEEMVGQDITLVVGDDEGNEFEITYRVSGIISNAPTSYPIYYMYTSYDGAIAQMNAYHFKHDQQYDSVAVLLDKNSNDTEKIMDLVVQIMDKYGEGEKFYANHIKFNEYRLEIFNNEGAYRGVRMTFYGIAVFIACCLVLFVYHTISMGMAEKIRQYGTMRCIGLDHIQLIKLMGMEMSLYALLGLILGILSGNVLNELVADRII